MPCMRARRLSLTLSVAVTPSRHWAGPDPPNAVVPSIGLRLRACRADDRRVRGLSGMPHWRILGCGYPQPHPSRPIDRVGGIGVGEHASWERAWPCLAGALPFAPSRSAPLRRGYERAGAGFVPDSALQPKRAREGGREGEREGERQGGRKCRRLQHRPRFFPATGLRALWSGRRGRGREREREIRGHFGSSLPWAWRLEGYISGIPVSAPEGQGTASVHANGPMVAQPERALPPGNASQGGRRVLGAGAPPEGAAAAAAGTDAGQACAPQRAQGAWPACTQAGPSHRTVKAQGPGESPGPHAV